jgi:glycine cleavage system H protein
MQFPENLKYTKEHEWVRVENDSIGVVGITDYAQSELGDIVYVELPQIGKQVKQLEPFGQTFSLHYRVKSLKLMKS